LALERAEAFVEAEQNVFRREAGQSRDLLRRIGRLAEERELQPQRADVRPAVYARGDVIRRVAMRVARCEDQLRKVEDFQIAIESLAGAEADEAIDVGRAA